MPLLRFLAAQALGWALVFAALLLGAPLAGPALAGVQGACAAAAARLLRSERWWLAAHLAFTPLVWLASQWRIAPAWYLGGFVALALFYWTSFRTRVPLFLSNRRTVAALAGLLPAEGGQVLDAGAGTGSVVRPLAAARPDCVFVGIEAAPAPWLIGRLLAGRRANLVWRRGDFWAADWSVFDLVYVFLSPVPMARVREKARAEMRPGTLLVSNSFAIPDEAPARVIEDAGGRTLFVYEPAGRAAKRKKARKTPPLRAAVLDAPRR